MALAEAIAETEAGWVRGRALGGSLRCWLGIPYASAPRFGAPVSPRPWQGVRDAIRFGPACPQALPHLPKAGITPGRFEEDCLRINIWSAAPPGKRLPVMVWIHGGAFLIGSGDLYDAAHLAASGEIVVATINYRLGVLGFCDLGSVLGEPVPGNLGLRDQIAALRWIRTNIARFGGDPDRVTIVGESAGAISVGLLLRALEAAGLFHGAAMQSGGINLIHGPDRAARMARRFVELLGLRSPDLAQLRALPCDRLLDAQNALQREDIGGVAATPWFDGALLPGSFEAAMAAVPAPVPLLAGFNRHEIRTFALLPDRMMPKRRESLERLLRNGLPDRADAVLRAYGRGRRGTSALATDLYFAMPTLHVAEHQSRRAASWVYRFDAGHPLFGAAHGMELLFLFELQGWVWTLLRGGRLKGRRRALAERMRRHWIAFVREGRPGEDWPAFDEDRRAILGFRFRRDRVLLDPDRIRRLAWDGRDVPTGSVP